MASIASYFGGEDGSEAVDKEDGKKKGDGEAVKDLAAKSTGETELKLIELGEQVSALRSKLAEVTEHMKYIQTVKEKSRKEEIPLPLRRLMQR